MSRSAPCMWMRGGTSKGGYFLADDLPAVWVTDRPGTGGAPTAQLRATIARAAHKILARRSTATPATGRKRKKR